MNKKSAIIILTVFLLLISSAHAYNTTLCLVTGYTYNASSDLIPDAGTTINITLQRLDGTVGYLETTVAGGFFLHLFHNCTPSVDNFTVHAWYGAYYGNNTTAADYNLEINVTTNETVAVSAPENFTIMSNSTGFANLSWSEVSDATTYNIYYSDNYSKLLDLDTDSLPAGVTNVTGLTDLNWTDTGSNELYQRFYRVASVLGSTENLSSETKGWLRLEYASSGLTMLSTPHNNSVITLGLVSSVGDPLPTIPANSLDYISFYNFGSWETSTYRNIAGWRWTTGDMSTISFNRGYFVNILTPCNITYCGTLLTSNHTVNFPSTGLTMAGWPSYTNYTLGLVSSVGDPLLTDPANSLDYISFYNFGSWETSTYRNIAGWRWTTGDMSTMTPGRGYFVNILTANNLTFAIQ
ncbi:MAG: hypothetical protein ABIG20_03385 [archaeon]